MNIYKKFSLLQILETKIINRNRVSLSNIYKCLMINYQIKTTSTSQQSHFSVRKFFQKLQILFTTFYDAKSILFVVDPKIRKLERNDILETNYKFLTTKST